MGGKAGPIPAPVAGNNAWQEGATSLSDNPVPGYGTIMTSQVANAVANGFDVATPAGPSIKVYNSTGNDYVSPPNTTGTPMYNIKGYMVLVRGDRSGHRVDQLS